MILSIYSKRCQYCGEEFIFKAKSMEERVYLKALIDAEWANHMMEHIFKNDKYDSLLDTKGQSPSSNHAG